MKYLPILMFVTMYAVIELQGHQYIVKEGDIITVDKIKDQEAGSKIVVDAIALFEEDASLVKVGTPFTGSKVSCEIIEHSKGKKIHVYKFKNKNRYSRKIGFRPQYSTLSIKKITV